MDEIKVGKLTKEELDQLKEEGSDKISNSHIQRKGDDLRLKDAMEDCSKEQFEAIQTWIFNNIQYVKDNISYLAIFATDELSQTMIKALMERIDRLKKEFESNSKPTQLNHRGLPFDQTILVHMRQNMLPLVAQIIPLKHEIEGFSKKFFKIKLD